MSMQKLVGGGTTLLVSGIIALWCNSPTEVSNKPVANPKLHSKKWTVAWIGSTVRQPERLSSTWTEYVPSSPTKSAARRNSQAGLSVGRPSFF